MREGVKVSRLMRLPVTPGVLLHATAYNGTELHRRVLSDKAFVSSHTAVGPGMGETFGRSQPSFGIDLSPACCLHELLIVRVRTPLFPWGMEADQALQLNDPVSKGIRLVNAAIREK